jgi:lipopolysaccharide export system protein LptA
MRVRSSGLAALTVLSAVLFPAPAQMPAAVAAEYSLDAKKPVHFQSERFDLYATRRRATFRGNAVLRRDSNGLRCSLRAQELSARYDQAGGVPSWGAGPFPDGIELLDVRASVDVSLSVSRDADLPAPPATFEVKAKEAFFNLHTDVITLSGDVEADEGGNITRSSRLTINLKSGMCTFGNAREQAQAFWGIKHVPIWRIRVPPRPRPCIPGAQVQLPALDGPQPAAPR